MPRQMLFLGRWLLWLALSQQAVTPLHAAEPVRFNPGFLNKTLGEVDLSRFSEGSPLSAGIYPSDIYINQVWLGQAEVRFKELDSNNDIALCFDENLLQMSKLKPSLIPPMQAKRLRDTSSCVTSQQLHPAIQWHYKMNSLSLEITLPQSLQTIAPRGETNPHKAQSGATVATLSYNLNSYHTRYNNESQDNRYLGLNGGANLGSWRLRHQSTLSKSNDDATTWDNLATYAERSLVNMTSHLRFGQGWTSGELFDSIGYQGVNLATDSRMLPSSQRGFAPTVRGNARTNARVTIEQNGKLLYETTVSPGSFIIDDLYPTGYGGDLQVTIHEADGQQQQFRVPYAAVPGLLRNDTTLYSATVGKIHEYGLTKSAPTFGELTLQHGFNNLLSGYGGINAMTDYSSQLLGSALNTSWGAFSLDITHSILDNGKGKEQGNRYRATYNKTLNSSGTQFSLSTRKASDEDYYSPREALYILDGSDSSNHEQKRIDLSLNQPIGSSNLYLIGSKSWYWQQTPPQQSLQLGYSSHIGLVNYQFAIQHIQENSGEDNQLYIFTLSMPLGRRNTLSLQLSHDRNNGNQMQGSVTGQAGAQSEFNYNLYASRSTATQQPDLNSIGGSGTYRGSAAYVNGNASRDSHQQQQYAFGLRGALVAHSGGISTTPELGDTFAIVKAPAADGASIVNPQGGKIDSSGYAIVPYLTPFESNRLDLDPQGMPDTVDLTTTTQSVIPDAGAAIQVSFPTRIGYGLLIESRLPDGRSPPFGADVLDGYGHVIGNVGQGGVLYARVSQLQGVLMVRWGEGSDQHCQLPFQLPAEASGLTTLSPPQVCQP